MNLNSFSKEKKVLGPYVVPSSDELLLGPQSIICTSQTEKVNEEDGEW